MILSRDKIVCEEGPLQRCDKLRKYATHLFSTPLSNAISDNVMSRLILILTKKFLIINAHILAEKLEKNGVECKSLKGLYFVA